MPLYVVFVMVMSEALIVAPYLFDPPLSQVGSGRTRTNPLFSGNRTVRALFLYRRTEV